MYNNDKVVLADGISNETKELTALVVEHWLEERNMWYSDGYKDSDSTELTTYFNEELSGFGPWTKNHSQSPFDIYSVNGKIAVELKSANVNAPLITGNATIYPRTAMLKDIVPINRFKPGYDENQWMDVLVVFVDGDMDGIVEYKIVDGSWWGYEREDFIACRELFPQVNSCGFKNIISDNFVDVNLFINKLVHNLYKQTTNLKLRKLIEYNNPIYKGNVKYDTVNKW